MVGGISSLVNICFLIKYTESKIVKTNKQKTNKTPQNLGTFSCCENACDSFILKLVN